MSASEIKDLVHKRGTIKGHMIQFKTYLINYREEPDPVKLSVKMKRLNNSFESFEDIQQSLEQLGDSSAQAVERETIEQLYDDLITTAQKLLNHKAAITATDAQIPRESPSFSFNGGSGVKFPKVDLPQFDGTTERWLSFKDQFTSLIGSQATLTNVQKLQYLRSVLSGEASKVLDAMDTTDDNYFHAWELLKKNYANNRLMVWRHGELLFNAPPIEKNSSVSLKHFINHIRQHVRSLKTLGQPVETWDTAIILSILPKLDRNMRMEFEKPFKSEVITTLEELITFLTDEARCLETAQKASVPVNVISKPIARSTPSDALKTTKPRYNQVLTTVIIPCSICSSNAHRVYECHELRSVPVSERTKLVQQHRLCYNCLRKGHTAAQCRSIRCRVCEGLHHTLLHVETSEPIPSEEVQA